MIAQHAPVVQNVPAGKQIGDFIVPQNGMWDIVEWKFYANKGTGNFVYGIAN